MSEKNFDVIKYNSAGGSFFILGLSILVSPQLRALFLENERKMSFREALVNPKASSIRAQNHRKVV